MNFLGVDPEDKGEHNQGGEYEEDGGQGAQDSQLLIDRFTLARIFADYCY